MSTPLLIIQKFDIMNLFFNEKEHSRKEVFMLIKMFAVGIGGFIGSVLRYLISLIPISQKSTFPFNTFITNIIGALLIGFIISCADKSEMAPEKLLLLKVGLCGGLTTFSTFSSETFRLLEGGNIITALAYIILSVGISVICVFLGMKLC